MVTGTSITRRRILVGAIGTAAAIAVPPAFAASASAQSGGYEPGSTFYVDTATGGGANLRAEASISGEVITVVSAGTEGRILQGPRSADGYDWYGVEIAGTTGWMASSVMAPGDGGDGADVQVADGPLNVRATPGLDGDILGTVAFAITGKVTAEMPQEADGYVWVNVRFFDTANTTGWVAREFLQFF
jgi:uncharacterized protein YgiM (DUF1202 family)